MSGYIGTQPVPQATQTRDAFTATANQTSFATSGYTPNFLDVYLNGVKLAAADYTATNSVDVVLSTGAALNDILEVVAFTTFQSSSNATAAQGTKADSALQSIADGSVIQAKLAGEAVNESKLQVSNAPTNGYFLSAQSGNTGGMTWAQPSGTPSGAVIYHAANTAPTGFLKANGAAISRSTYAALFAVIGTTYGAGDGSSTFLVPDLRGEFLRGWDDSRGVDGSRSFGSAQAEAFKSHKHTSGMGNVYDAASPDYGYNSASRFAPLGRWAGTTTAYFPHTSNTGGSETRPRNIALLACIKY
tara:strand:+ start:937 stop:1842 length:906 start_codon:yes stop_codon:yes gene_type:complete